MNYDMWITILASGGITALGFTALNGVNWYLLSRSTDEANNKLKKSKIQFFLGVLGVAITTSIMVVLLVRQDSPLEPDQEPSIVDSDPKASEPEQDNYVTDKRYDGGKYTGYINPETKVPQGKGTMRYIDGNKYEGEWEDGQRHGSGKMTYKNGDSYNGQWENGQKQGEGIYIWHDGGRYEGSYKNNMRDGEGDYFGWSGFVSEYGWSGDYHGFSREDYFEGSGRFEFENGDVFVGTFHNNEFWTGVYTHSDGKQFTISNGVPGR